MKVLIIGGTGFIGSYVTRRLSETGHTVTVFHRGRTGLPLPSYVIAPGFVGATLAA